MNIPNQCHFDYHVFFTNYLFFIIVKPASNAVV